MPDETASERAERLMLFVCAIRYDNRVNAVKYVEWFDEMVEAVRADEREKCAESETQLPKSEPK